MAALKKWQSKLDKKPIGLLLGIIFPILAFIVYWQWLYGDKNFSRMIYLLRYSSNRSNMLIFPILPNLVLFYFSNFRLKWERFSLGIVLVTIIFTLLITILILF